MNCQRLESLISDYLEDQLDPRVRGAADRHLQTCPSCTFLVGEVSQLRSDLADLPQLSASESLIDEILQRTSGIPAPFSLWRDLVQPTLAPFRTPRFGFATVLMFVFLSLVANYMMPDGEVSANLTLAERADRVSERVYRTWLDFNRLKERAREEITLWREDVLGRLDYHLITLLFRSYEEETGAASGEAVDSEADNSREDNKQ